MLNGDKSELLILYSRFTTTTVDFPMLCIGQAELKGSNSARNLGVLFDSGMTLAEHISNVARSASFELCKLGSIRKYLTKDSTEILVHAFISSRLDYCNSLYINLPQYLIKKLQGVQNTAARIVSRVRKYDHITPVLKELHWLPVQQRIVYKIALFTFKAVHGVAPEYICELIHVQTDGRYPRRGDNLLLKVPKSNMVNYGDRSFSVAAPRVWNILPYNVRSSANINTFKSRLKTHLFHEYYI